MKKSLLWILVSIFLIPFTIADQFVLIDINILTEEGNDIIDYYIGSEFYYNISLKNIDEQEINTELTVRVFDPKEKLVHQKRYPVNLKVNETKFLFPFYNYKGKIQEDMHDIIIFKQMGPYKIELSVPEHNQIDWIYKKNEKWIRQEPRNFSYYIYSMSHFEKLMLEREKERIEKLNSSNKEAVDLQKKAHYLNALGILIFILFFLIEKKIGFKTLKEKLHSRVVKMPVVYNWYLKRKRIMLFFLIVYFFTLPLYWVLSNLLMIPEDVLIWIFMLPFALISIFMVPFMIIFLNKFSNDWLTIIISYYLSIISFFLVLIFIDLISFLSKKYPQLIKFIGKLIKLLSIFYLIVALMLIFILAKSQWLKISIIVILGIWFEVIIINFVKKKSFKKRKNT